jgi:hypothetical protein
MSSESISPAGFYSVRGFGYKRFEKVEPNNLNRRIILYDKYPIFNTDDKELENYPMVIEIDTETVSKGAIQRHKDGVYYSEETIYLNPFSTSIFFRAEHEKVSALSKAEPSIETKMVVLYKDRLRVKEDGIESFKWQGNEIPDTPADFSKHISKDQRINKLKGFLYAYILAANKSLSPEVVTLKKYAKELRNTLSAVLVSPDGRETDKQGERLAEIYKTINGIFRKKLGNRKPLFQMPPFYVSMGEKAFESCISDLEEAIDRCIDPKSIQKEDFPKLQHDKIAIVPSDEFLPKLFNEYLEEKYNREEFMQSRYVFAISGGKIFRYEISKKWEGSEFQLYINALLKNLNEHSPFEMNSTEDLRLKSFAAFCQKGEDDIDKLEDYLISNEIGDFRIAFALWGIVFGFANMPKTLTDDLFLSGDLNYVSEIYKYIFHQVHNIELERTLKNKHEKECDTAPSKKEELKVEEEETKAEMVFREKLEQVPRMKKSQIDSVIGILKNNHFRMDDKVLSEISNTSGIGKITVEKIRTCLHLQSNDSLGFWSFQNEAKPDKDFYEDRNIFGLIECLLPNTEGIKKQFKDDLDWFQDNYREYYYDKKGVQQKGRYFASTKDNDSVIKHFNSYLKDKQNQKDGKKNTSWLQAIYKEVDIDKIISKLKELYLPNEQQNQNINH